MIRLRELLTQVIQRKKLESPTANSAQRMGLTKKPGFGNWGPPDGPFITHRTLPRKNSSTILPVVPHRIGQKSTLKPVQGINNKKKG
jgi:hypothetical protein